MEIDSSPTRANGLTVRLLPGPRRRRLTEVHSMSVTTHGTVRFWHDEEGWGVIDSPDTPGGCWTHFSVVAVDGYASLSAGQAVRLEWEPADQDGYRFRTVRTWPADQQPVQRQVQPPSAAVGSLLRLRFDERTGSRGADKGARRQTD